MNESINQNVLNDLGAVRGKGLIGEVVYVVGFPCAR
jgi:hypothetical protein